MKKNNNKDSKHTHEKLKINFILPRSSLAGGIKSNKLIAEALVRRGHCVHIIYISAPIPMPSIWNLRTFIKRIYDDLKFKNKIGHHLEESIADLIPVKSEIINHYDVPDADVTIATWWQTAEWISKWPDSKGLKAHFIRGYETFSGYPELVKATYRLPLYKIVISKWLQQLMSDEYGIKNTLLIPNGVDRNQFNSTKRSKSNIPTVGFMYSLHPLKDIETTLIALKEIQKKFPTLKVISFGSKKWDKKHEQPANLEYHLAPPQKLIPELYRSADCWIISSTSEGFYMPGIEAAACRCPLVSTRCGGPEDYIENGKSGFLVGIKDSDGIAKSVMKILNLENDKWIQMSEASYKKTLNFDWDLSAEKLEKALLRKIKK